MLRILARSLYVWLIICGHSYAAAEALSEVPARVTIQGRNLPLKEVLTAVIKQTGWRIEIYGDLDEAREISLSLTDVPLFEGIERILQARDFILSWEDDKHLIIYLLPASSADLDPGQPFEYVDLNQTESRSGSAEEVAFPPKGIDDFALTGAKFETGTDLPTMILPEDIEIFPPTLTGEPGPTLKDLEFFHDLEPMIEVETLELFPSDDEDKNIGISTYLESLESFPMILNISDLEMFPSTQNGQANVTVDEYEQVINDRLVHDRNAFQAEELFPMEEN